MSGLKRSLIEKEHDRLVISPKAQNVTSPLKSRKLTKSVFQSSSTNEANYQKPGNLQLDESKRANYSEVMITRWMKQNRMLPDVDLHDVKHEVPIINGGKVIRLEDRRQHNAEYSQSSYIHMHKLEKYFKLAVPIEFRPQGGTPNNRVHNRNWAVGLIFSLHEQKKYKFETAFRAVSILDRYFATLEGSFPPSDVFRQVPVVSLLIAAKLEETVSPSFKRMYDLLD